MKVYFSNNFYELDVSLFKELTGTQKASNTHNTRLNFHTESFSKNYNQIW